MTTNGLQIEKAVKNRIRHWVLAVAAWLIFIVSFFLPAADNMPGWKAATMQSWAWPQAMQGKLFAIHYLALNVANLFVVATPFFMAWGTDDVQFVKWLRGLSIAAAVLVGLFLAWPQVGDDMANFRIGCYLWATSFVLLCVAAWLQPVPLKAKASQRA